MWQNPSQAMADSPRLAPYRPAGHDMAVPLVEPAGHQEPAEQLPEHRAEPRPGKAPYLPAGHRNAREDVEPAGQ